MFYSFLLQSDYANAEENGWNKTNGIYGSGYCSEDTPPSSICREVDGQVKCCYKQRNSFGLQDYGLGQDKVNPAVRDQFNQLTVEVLYNQLSKQINKICPLILQDTDPSNDQLRAMCVKKPDETFETENILNKNMIETMLLVSNFTFPTIDTNNNNPVITFKTCNVDKCSVVYSDSEELPQWGPNNETVKSSSNCYTCTRSYNNYKIDLNNPINKFKIQQN